MSELRHRIFLDFGKDLPISGGEGQRIDDPIRLMVGDAIVAARTQFDVVKCIYEATNRYWRIVERSLLSELDRRTEQFKISSRFADGESIIEEVRNIYFDTSAINLVSQKWLPTATVSVDSPIEIDLACKIGWFSFDALVDNEANHPGQGSTLFYSAPRSKMSIYIYDNGLQDIISADPNGAVAEELSNAERDLLCLNPGAYPLNILRNQNENIRYYNLGGGCLSLLMVRPIDNVFFKVRASAEVVGDELAEQAIVETALTLVNLF